MWIFFTNGDGTMKNLKNEKIVLLLGLTLFMIPLTMGCSKKSIDTDLYHIKSINGVDTAEPHSFEHNDKLSKYFNIDTCKECGYSYKVDSTQISIITDEYVSHHTYEEEETYLIKEFMPTFDKHLLLLDSNETRNSFKPEDGYTLGIKKNSDGTIKDAYIQNHEHILTKEFGDRYKKDPSIDSNFSDSFDLLGFYFSFNEIDKENFKVYFHDDKNNVRNVLGISNDELIFSIRLTTTFNISEEWYLNYFKENFKLL